MLGPLGEGTQTLPRPHSELPTLYSTAVRVSYGGVHVIRLGATHTPPRPHSAWPTPYSTLRIAVRVSYGGVHTIFSI
eukprot:7340666-Prymnesium_polylepis.1